jgi:hypothetical protein
MITLKKISRAATACTSRSSLSLYTSIAPTSLFLLSELLLASKLLKMKAQASFDLELVSALN